MLQVESTSETPGNNLVMPFLKWAGGKRWLVARHPALFPEHFNRYIEPFLGSGAVFFFLNPRASLLADSNAELVSTYIAVRDNWQAVYRRLAVHQERHTYNYYYEIRRSVPRSPASRAAKFIYLNRTCWNGLYRVNLSGIFNVPKGTKDSVLLDTDNWEEVSRRLKPATLVAADFEATIDRAGKGDFIFADPPYTVKHNLNGFIKYNEALFTWDDQIRMHAALLRAKKKGAKILATNANHQPIRRLYEDAFDVTTVRRQSALSADPTFRGSVEEVVIRG